MALNDTTIWGIHGGRTGDADSLFLQHDCVALGWHEVGDLRNLPAERDAFKNRVGDVYPDWTPGKKINAASQLFRFMHEMKEGDLVCYPSKADRQIHIGKISGTYRFDSSLVPSYPNRRATKWLTSVPRTKFTQCALYEVGSALSLFQAQELCRRVSGSCRWQISITPNE